MENLVKHKHLTNHLKTNKKKKKKNLAQAMIYSLKI